MFTWDNLLSGISLWVDSYLEWIWSVIPMLLLIGLPILFVYVFWKWIYSYLKHILVWWKLPEWDHITNCDLVEKNWEFIHQYRDRRWQWIMSHSLPWDDENVYISWVGRVKKKDLPKYVDENLDFDSERYMRDHY